MSSLRAGPSNKTRSIPSGGSPEEGVDTLTRTLGGFWFPRSPRIRRCPALVPRPSLSSSQLLRLHHSFRILGHIKPNPHLELSSDEMMGSLMQGLADCILGCSLKKKNHRQRICSASGNLFWMLHAVGEIYEDRGK